MTKSEIRNPKSEIRTGKGQTGQELRAHPAVRNYTLFCLVALFLLVVCLADRGLGWWCLMPALIGGIALLACWSLGPPMVILSLTGLILSAFRYRWRYRDSEFQVPALMDLVLCAAVLAYVMGHYRLLSLMRHVFPADPRQARGTSSDPTQRRSADLVSAGEMALLALALPLFTGVSVMVWGWMMEKSSALGIPIETWRTLRVVWVVLAVLVTTAAVAGFVRQTTATPEEALLYLQDQLWRPTRREQGNINRWLAWARLRAQRRREAK